MKPVFKLLNFSFHLKTWVFGLEKLKALNFQDFSIKRILIPEKCTNDFFFSHNSKIWKTVPFSRMEKFSNFEFQENFFLYFIVGIILLFFSSHCWKGSHSSFSFEFHAIWKNSGLFHRSLGWFWMESFRFLLEFWTRYEFEIQCF